MTDSLGLSIGTTNLVVAPAGRWPVSRRSVLTLFDRRAAEVGVPEENPNLTEPGLVVRGFVERVGDPVPLVAADGSTHRGEQLLAEALDALARTVGHAAPVAVAVPAHWGPEPVAALRSALATKPGLAPQGTPPPLISDAATAIAALYAQPGLPSRGVVVLCDFGGNGSNITLLDAASNFAPIAATVRFPGLSGERIDQAVVDHVLADIHGATDPASTAAVGSLTRLRGECRLAKERLSVEAHTVIGVELPGFTGGVPCNRAELDTLIAGPLAAFLDTVTDTLASNRIPMADVAAVASVGGGAAIPVIAAQLSERLRAPVVTAEQPALSAAVGAGLLAAQGPPAGPEAEASAPTSLSPTSTAPAAWAAGATATEAMAEAPKSATFRALAWSQDDSGADEPVPYSGEDYSVTVPGTTGQFEQAAEPEPLAWYKRPIVLFGLAAALALAATGGLAYTLTGTSSPSQTHTSVPGEPTPLEAPPPTTVTVTQENGETSVSTIQPPPPPPDSTTTTAATSQPTTTSTTAAPTTTTRSAATTTPPPTTTRPTTTQSAATTTRSQPAVTTPPPVETTGGG